MRPMRLSPGQMKHFGHILADRDSTDTYLAVSFGQRGDVTILVKAPKWLAKKDPAYLNRKPVDVQRLVDGLRDEAQKRGKDF